MIEMGGRTNGGGRDEGKWQRVGRGERGRERQERGKEGGWRGKEVKEGEKRRG